MTLVIYNDTGPGYWGATLYARAKERGISARLHRSLVPDPAHEELLYFCRPEQRNTQYAIRWAAARNCPGVQSLPEIVDYERKDLQAATFKRFMPDTFLAREGCTFLRQAYEEWKGHSGSKYTLEPFVLKLPHGSGSRNVAMIYDKQDLDAYSPWLSRVRDGQQAVLQTMLPALLGVWRVTKIGSRAWIYWNANREHDCTASGSGNYTPLTEYSLNTAEQVDVWNFAHSIWDEYGCKWGGLDIAYCDGRPWLLETTLAWGYTVRGAHADTGVRYRNGNRAQPAQTGSDQWDVLLDCIERGEFA